MEICSSVFAMVNHRLIFTFLKFTTQGHTIYSGIATAPLLAKLPYQGNSKNTLWSSSQDVTCPESTCEPHTVKA